MKPPLWAIITVGLCAAALVAIAAFSLWLAPRARRQGRLLDAYMSYVIGAGTAGGSVVLAVVMVRWIFF